jgi:hypothetical protein
MAAPITSNTATNPIEVVAGAGVSVSAEGDRADAITAAEYFVGSDPGEGNGVAMSVQDFTTYWRYATIAPIDTTGFSGGTYTVSVRGFTVADGWGPVDTDTFNVTALATGGRVSGMMRLGPMGG